MPISAARLWLCHGSQGRLSQLFLQQRLITAAVDSPRDGNTLCCRCSPQTCHSGFASLETTVTGLICALHMQQLTLANSLFLPILVTSSSKLTQNQTSRQPYSLVLHLRLLILLLTVPSHITPDACFHQIQPACTCFISKLSVALEDT